MMPYAEWLNKLDDSAKIAVQYIIKKLKHFPGRIAIIGSSANKKCPIGNDIDIVLVGLGVVKGKKYVRELFTDFSKEFNQNLLYLAKGRTAQDLKYPLIVDIRHTLDDPEVSEIQELVKGHGGTNINIAIRPKELKYNKQFLEDFVKEVKENRSGNTRIWFDIIVDLSYTNKGLKDNFLDWKNVMDAAGQKYILL